MGGLSQGMSQSGPGYMKYMGQLSLANNGGFSQIRMDIDDGIFSGAEGIELRVRGTDPNRKFKIFATASTSDWNLNMWEADLPALQADWFIVRVPFDQLKLQIMGEYVENGGLISGDMVKKIGFFIMDKNTDEFEMHVEYIKPYGQTQAWFQLRFLVDYRTFIFPRHKSPSDSSIVKPKIRLLKNYR